MIVLSKPSKYCLSFTTASLLHQASVNLANEFLTCNDWQKVREIAIEKNILQVRRLNSLKRLTSEAITRLKTLEVNKLKYLVQAYHQDQAYMLWLAICRRHQFIADFAKEITAQKLLTFDYNLNYNDFNHFFNYK